MRIGVLGCGNMASAVVEGMWNADPMGEIDFVTYTPSRTRAVTLAAKVKGRAVSSLGELGHPDMIIIGCKPHQFSALAGKLLEEKVLLKEVVSIMAAVSIRDIQSALKAENVIRLMPSLPMRYGEGISLLYYASCVGPASRRFLHKTLGKCSKIFEPDSEELLDRLTLVAASGPAYVYYLTRAFEEMLNCWQGSTALSRALAVQLFKGSSVAMDRERETSLEDLIARVTSEKGVTGEAIADFEKNDVKGSLHKGIQKAWERLNEIRESKF